jgi:serine phosphatase RsbU (regulator of sigma subunit)/catechol 2,3-dioxygenase-like lactoylglutathione lyase family enzyme
MSEPSPLTSPRHLRLFGVEVVVRDPDRGLDFYVNLLGFRLIADVSPPEGQRMIAVAPPDGSSILVLVQAPPGTVDEGRGGRHTGVFLVTNDIAAQYDEWSALGVHFEQVPRVGRLDSRNAIFADPDGNTFNLIQSNKLTEQLELERRAAERKREEERRTAREMEISRDVQARLFPHNPPRLATLDCVGLCLPAREVGGDYYDLLDLGPRRLGIVIGDVSGKGISAALLMANLQASLRSQSMRAVQDLAGALEYVNHLFLQNSSGASYTTLFFGAYDEATRRLQYANWGHLPALLLHGDGSVDRLASTCPVLGMFEAVKCVVDEVQLREEDALVLYTDGLTEARSSSGEEFGEDRLVDALRRGRVLSATALLQSIVQAVQDFSGNSHEDDMTLLVARASGLSH